MYNNISMLYRIFTLYPQIFDSYLKTSLMARAISKNIITFELINWREKFAKGNHKQVDDKPFGGGSGMVLQCQPIYEALLANSALGNFFGQEKGFLPNNSKLYELTKQKNIKSLTINLTPKGFPIDQRTMEWLSGFETLNILCGRFEGFDERVNTVVDLELSLGDFVLNGGEVASMALCEGISRLLPDFITKKTSIEHESFSLTSNHYSEQEEYSKILSKIKKTDIILFDDQKWLKRIQLYEQPIYTRPQVWQGLEVPKVLVDGNHKEIQLWRNKWYIN